MRKTFLRIAILATCFLIGWAAASRWIAIVSEAEKFDQTDVLEIETEPVVSPIPTVDIDAEFDPDIDYAKTLKVKLLIAGSLHSEEVPYKSGERWLGLFPVGDGFELASTTISVERDPKGGLFNAEVKTKREGESLFLLRGASYLSEGPIQTIFNSRSEEFTVPFEESDNVKSYSFNESIYTLRIENPAPNGFLHKGSTLTLENDGRRQVLRYLADDCDDCGWSVEWVGDIDRDGRLDFYLDLNGHYNSYVPTLFLSSKAKDGKIVGVFAGFRGVGC